MGAVSGPRMGADIMVECLIRNGVDVVFAYPGGCSMAIHQALTRVADRVRTILPRHEQGGGFAAAAYARATGRTGVCVATSGPGATNLIPCLADARRYGVPLVAITGQVHTHTLGTDAFQEIPIVSMCRNITKHHYLLTRSEDLTRVFKEAFLLATTGRPGPVLVDVPKDVQFRSIVPDFDPPLSFRANLPMAREWLPQELPCAAAEDEPREAKATDPPAPRAVLQALRALLEKRGWLDQACLTAGLGPEQEWLAGVFPPRAWMTSQSISANGFALPAALGVQAAHPARCVVAVATPDNLLVNVHELACAYCEKLPVKVLLLSPESTASPDFTMLARGFRCAAQRVERDADLPVALAALLDGDGPCLLDVRVAIPPPLAANLRRRRLTSSTLAGTSR